MAKPSFNPLLNPIDLTAIAVGTTISLGAIFGSIYILTRPCSFGGCQALVKASSRWQQLETALQQSDTRALIELQPQLERSQKTIQAIPRWSSYHQTAQAWQNQYQQLDSLNLILNTRSTIPTESVKNENLTLVENQQYQSAWQQAIDSLQTVASTDKFYPLAKKTIQEYQSKLDQIEPIVAKQTEYQQQLQDAETAAAEAITAQNEAQTPAEWQQVEQHWQAALASLEAIETSARDEQVKTLISSYEKQLTAAQKRRDLESLVADKIEQVKQHQSRAKQFQNENKWSQAVMQWQTTVQLAQSIPQNSSQSERVETLIDLTKTHLAQSRQIQQVQTDLNTTCSGKITICQVEAKLDKIKVQLTSQYTEKIWQTAIAAKAKQQYDKQIDLLVHINSLETNLATIGNNYKIPLELYSHQGELITTY